MVLLLGRRTSHRSAVSITTLRCVGGPFDGKTIDVNDRVLVGDAPIEVITRDGATGQVRTLGAYHVRAIVGERPLVWVSEEGEQVRAERMRERVSGEADEWPENIDPATYFSASNTEPLERDGERRDGR